MPLIAIKILFNLFYHQIKAKNTLNLSRRWIELLIIFRLYPTVISCSFNATSKYFALHAINGNWVFQEGTDALWQKKNLTYCEVLRCHGKKMPEKECYWCFFWAKFWPKNCDQNKIVFDSERSWAVKPSPCPVFRDFCSNLFFIQKHLIYTPKYY